MKKKFKNPIFTFVLGGIIVASIVTVYAISADSIEYNDTTVKGALDDLYTTQSNELEKYQTFNIQLRSSTSSSTRLAETSITLSRDSGYRKYKYFKINSLTSTDTSLCNVQGYHNENQVSETLTADTEYNVVDYGLIYVNAKSNTDGTFARCLANITFYN